MEPAADDGDGFVRVLVGQFADLLHRLGVDLALHLAMSIIAEVRLEIATASSLPTIETLGPPAVVMLPAAAAADVTPPGRDRQAAAAAAATTAAAPGPTMTRGPPWRWQAPRRLQA